MRFSSIPPAKNASVRGLSRTAAWLLVAGLCLGGAQQTLAACYDRTDGMQRRFILDGGEAYDAKTGLTWQRRSLGTRWDGKHACIGEQACFIILIS
jgi:hypothetical protein